MISHGHLIKSQGALPTELPDQQASINKLNIKNYEVLTLHDNVHIQQNGSQINSDELIYNLMTDTIISNQRIKLKNKRVKLCLFLTLILLM